MTPEPILAVALLSCGLTLMVGVFLGRATLPEAKGFYARR